MTGRDAFSVEIAARAKAIEGWTVRPRTNGWKLTNPDGRVIVLHTTPGDVNTDRAVTTELRAMGFFRDEQRQKRTNERERAAKLMADRAANDRKLKLAESRELARAKAAGELVEFDPRWLFASHEKPAMREGIITPALAEKLLMLNTDNRPKKEKSQKMAARALRDGRYLLTHEALALSTAGVILDGQNRLMAIVETGVAAPFFVAVGMDPLTRDVIGRGSYRSAFDTFSMAKVPNAMRVASITRLLMTIEAAKGNGVYDIRPDNDEALARFRQDPEGFLGAHAEASAMVGYGKSSARLRAIGLVTMGAVIYRLRSVEPSADLVTDFLEGVRTGASLKHGDARLALRDWNEAARERHERPHRIESAAVVILAWNAWIAGERIVRLSWKRGQPFPIAAHRSK